MVFKRIVSFTPAKIIILVIFGAIMLGIWRVSFSRRLRSEGFGNGRFILPHLSCNKYTLV